MLSRQVDMDTTLNTIVKCIRQQRHANGNDDDGLKIKVIYQNINRSFFTNASTVVGTTKRACQLIFLGISNILV